MRRYEVVFSLRARANFRSLRDFKLLHARSREDAEAVLEHMAELPLVIAAKLAHSPMKYVALDKDGWVRELKLDTGISAAFRVLPRAGKVIVLAIRDQRQMGY